MPVFTMNANHFVVNISGGDMKASVLWEKKVVFFCQVLHR